MNKFRVRISLRYKLLFVLTSLPLLSLGLYLLMATDLFQKDKVAYVFDSTATVSRALASQTRMEAQSIYNTFRGIAENYDINISDFNALGKDQFTKNDRMRAVVFYRRDESGQYVKLSQLAKEIPAAQKFILDEEKLRKILAHAVGNTAFLEEAADGSGDVNLGFRLGDLADKNHLVIVGLYQDQDLMNAFATSAMYSSFMTTRGGVVTVNTIEVVPNDLPLLRPILTGKAHDGTAELKLSDGMTYLISFSEVGLGNLLVISKVDKSKALKAVDVLIAKSVLFFLALLATTLLISVYASNQLTGTLLELFDATTKIAHGDFSVRVVSRSKDEVGGLAESFNWMAAEVSRLMSETAEKARMESELSTVRTVQETLFPAPDAEFGPLKISGHFEPASECGGDWWNYSRIGSRIYLWVGDATGHGAPAALITSAARSAAAVIEALPDMDPGKALTVLNRAIHQTSKGQIMMTFFVAAIDLDARTFSYACASHDPPYLLRRKGDKLSRKDLQPLNEVNGPRLGDQKDFVYKDVTIAFEPGDLLFFYTDGILDVENPDGKKWGERAFLKSLIDSANDGNGIQDKLIRLRTQLNSFRAGSSLIDDVTMVMCEFEKVA